jgi:hypothetical protein
VKESISNPVSCAFGSGLPQAAGFLAKALGLAGLAGAPL